MDSNSASIETSDPAFNLLTGHIARYLEQGFTEARVRKALEPNELKNDNLDRAISAAQSLLEAKRLAKEVAQDSERKKKHRAAKSELKKAIKKVVKDDPESSAGAEALLQGMAVSLHDVPAKPKTKPAAKITEDLTPIPAQSIGLGMPPPSQASAKLSLTEEILGIQTPWGSTPNPEIAVPAPVVARQPPAQPGGMVVGQQQTAVWDPQAQAAYTAAYPAARVQALNTQTYAAQLAPQLASTRDTSYSALQALIDSFAAARNNFATYIISVVLAFIVAGSSFFLVGLAINKFFVIPFSSLLASPAKLMTSVVGSLALYAVWYILAGAFVLTATSLALFDGSQSRTSTIGNVLTKSLSQIVRMLKALATLGAIALGPMAVVALVPVIAVSIHGAKSLAYVLPTLYLAALVWSTAVGLRYALVPYVALFEPGLNLKQSFGRSSSLLAGSQKTMLMGILPFLTVVGALVAFVHYRPQAVLHPANVVINLVLLLIALIANGALVMLYCNRRLFKA